MKNYDFKDKKYMVFGASSGIGKQTAIELSFLGARLILVGRDELKLNETMASLSNDCHRSISCDVSNFENAQKVVKEAVNIDGIRLDGCVFSVGIYSMLPLSSVNEATLKDMFSTNFFSVVAIAKSFASRRISNDGASFVSVSSRAAMMPDKAQGIYGATKAAINAYTIAAAKEMASRHIRFNAVCPEAVNTPMGVGLKTNMPEEIMKRIYPLEMLEASDVADTVMYLLSDCSKKITGQSIWLSAGNDGGAIEGHIF